MRVVVEVADAYAHMPLDVVGDGDRDRKSEDRVRHAEAVDVALTAKDLAGSPSSEEADAHQYRIGNVD